MTTPDPSTEYVEAPYELEDGAEVERLDWHEFLDSWRWRRGEHVTIIGPTGAGKTVLMLAIIPRHPDVVIVSHKPRDSTVRPLYQGRGWQLIRSWPPPMVYDDRSNHYVLRLPAGEMDSVRPEQRRILHRMFQRIYAGPPGSNEDQRGLWTIALPDLHYLDAELKLDDDLALLWWHGRDLRISMVIDVQAPVGFVRAGLDQPTHFFMFRPHDRARMERLREIGMGDMDAVEQTLTDLDAERHEVLYVDGVSGRMVVTKVE